MVIKSLGGLNLEGANFHRPKPLLLLCYLAIEGPQQKRHLAELFWLGAENPNGNLATTLTRLRKGAPGSVETDDSSVWTSVQCDLTMFFAALDTGFLNQAERLYQGPFLMGFSTRGLGAEIENWVFGMREFAAERLRKVLLELAEHEAGQHRFREAAVIAERSFFLPGAAEAEPEDIERLFTLMLAGGSPRTDEVRKAAEAYELPLATSVDAAKAQLVRTRSRSGTIPNNLPSPRMPFVGREVELAEIGTLLSRPEQRLVTLLGPPGVGKSQLSIQVAADQLRSRHFPDGVFLVELDNLTTANLIPVVIAEALGMDLRGAHSVLAQVIRFVGEKGVLLVLDNYEHLIEAASLTTELLSTCPNLKLLVTSRVRLRVREEWIFDVDGMDYPEDPTLPLEQVLHFDAVRLLVLRSRQTRFRRALTQGSVPAIVKICTMLDGLPLGIELAASWLRYLPPQSIADEIEKNLGFLETTTRNVPERHKSIKAAFESSWRLLSAREQGVLRRLSVFFGGFSHQAALEVVGATLPVLAALVDKSLLRVNSAGRYDRHPLVYWLTVEKLAEDPDERVRYRERHGAFFLDFFEERHNMFRLGADAREGFRAVEEDFSNVRLAWAWAIEQRKLTRLESTMEPIWVRCEVQARYQEGVELMQQVILGLEQGDPDEGAVVGAAMGVKALLLNRLGLPREVMATARRAVDLLNQGHARDASGLWRGYQALGHGSATLGDYPRAVGYIHKALEVATGESRSRNGNPLARLWVPLSLVGLGFHETSRGNYAQAKWHLNEAWALFRHENNLALATYCPYGLARIQSALGDFEGARTWLEQGLRAVHETDFKAMTPAYLSELAQVSYARGDHVAALSISHEALAQVRETGDRRLETLLLALQGRVRAAQGRYREASESLMQGLSAAWSTRLVACAFAAIVGFIDLWIREGQLKRAADLLGPVLALKAMPQPDRAEAERLLGALRGRLPAASIDASVGRGAPTGLDDLVEILVRPSLPVP